MIMHKLQNITKDDAGSIREYVYRRTDHALIADIKVIWDSESKRNGDTWEGLAIRFQDNLSQLDLIRAIVSLKPDEYWGLQDGYHLFWFD
jgi:hypothetical protein